MSDPATEPTEQLPISLFESVILAVRDTDGAIYLSIRDICQSIGIAPNVQLRRLRTHMILSEGISTFRVQTAGGMQRQEFLTLELIPTWLLMINSARVLEAAKPKLVWFQRYIVREVYSAFAALAGLPSNSQQIEDLDDLRRIDAAFTTLSERQQALETSQDRARGAWKELRDEIRAIANRVVALEQGTTPISREQRGYIYHAVHAWAAAKIARESRLGQDAALMACWVAVKTRYRVARYEDIATANYADCVAFINEQYRALTGSELTIPEQRSLELE
jgi:P22_AR N-terminal domain